MDTNTVQVLCQAHIEIMCIVHIVLKAQVVLDLLIKDLMMAPEII